MDGRLASRVLLELTGTARPCDPARLRLLGQDDWARLEAMAVQHRLAPLLHSLHKNNPAIPAATAERWRQAGRQSAMAALAQRADLVECTALLKAGGHDPVALKGAYLARHAYPAAAQRPMRDIDLLLPRGSVLAAYRLLLGSGYRAAYEAKISLEDVARFEAHMPPLIMPRGSVLELHARLSELDGRLEYRTPAGNEERVLAGAIEVDGLCYPDPGEMLAHLVVHAIYGHRLDCGPLLLTDIHFLAASHKVDWPAFWSGARSGGWEAGARLVVELVRIYHGNSALPVTADEPATPPAAIVELALDLVLQNYETKNTARFMATLMSGGVTRAFRRASGRIAATGETAISIDRQAEGGRLRWAADRFKHVWREFSDPGVRRQSRQLAQFRRWLERGAG